MGPQIWLKASQWVDAGLVEELLRVTDGGNGAEAGWEGKQEVAQEAVGGCVQGGCPLVGGGWAC